MNNISSAAFWKEELRREGEKGNSVIRHAPDAENYHKPEMAQLSKMPGGFVGAFAVVPAANKDGDSKGFDPTVAGPVHVDPYSDDGGVMFDPSTVREQDMHRAMAQSVHPSQVFYSLGQPAKLAAYRSNPAAVSNTSTPYMGSHGFKADAGPNPYMPKTYVTPSTHAEPVIHVTPFTPVLGEHAVSNPTIYEQPQMQPQLPQQPQLPVQPQAQLPATQYAYPVPPMDPNMAAMMNAMLNMQQQLASIKQAAVQPSVPLPPTTGVSPIPMPTRATARRPSPMHRDPNRNIKNRNVPVEDEPEEDYEPQTLREYEQQAQQPAEAVITGFETLRLPFVTGPLPNKPRQQVFFDIPGAGRILANFHSVVDSDTCVVLIYDTRYDQGYQYSPPELGEGKLLTMHIKLEREKSKTYRVASLGLAYACGVFEHIVLVKPGGKELDYVNQEEEPEE